ncbi:hypothetical protein [Methanogenium organophilum]|uniref:Flagellin n=1 Tax=Methanogenium organophilum TaxID=2199 RepID=A0A9X9S6D3_METOG|nr:hypothetical protein [Methanogenium organophilum]WAI02250.1 hypothetical protein OU421_05100 [Methanogenium organophilum]
MRWQRTTDEDGMMGIEAAIILITAVVAASVLAMVILNLGYFSAEKTRSVAEEGVNEAGTTVVTTGSIHGVERGESLGALRVTFVIPAGSDMIDFSRVQVSVATPDNIVAIAAADPLVTDAPLAGTWGIIRRMPAAAEEDLFLEDNERFTIEVSLPEGQEIPVKGEFVLTVILPDSGSWRFAGVAPSKTDPVMILV